MWVSCGEQHFPIHQMKPKSGGLVKACVQEKKLFCFREIEFFMTIQTE